MYRIKLRFCIDENETEDNEKLINGMFKLLTANNKDHRCFIPLRDHGILSRLVTGITHTEFIEVNGDDFRERLRQNILGCDQLTAEEVEEFLEVVDLMRSVGEEQPVVNSKIPILFRTAKLK